MSIGGATYDVFVRLNHDAVHPSEDDRFFSLSLGEKIRVREVIETCGGGGNNTAIGLARLGCDARMAGVVGSDQWGTALVRNFEKEGVCTDCLTIVEDETTSFSIILSAASGERVILYDPGTNDHLHDTTFDRQEAASMDWVILNHIQQSTSVIEDDLIAMLAAPLPRLTWNPGGFQIATGIANPGIASLLKNTDLLVLNREEALHFSGQSTVDDALRKLLSTGAARVCITDGRRGSTVSDGKMIYRCPVLEGIDVVDTTGAGDAFCTGVTWGLLQGWDLPIALRTGTINSASVVGAIGAQAGLLTDIEMIRRLEATEIRVDAVTL